MSLSIVGFFSISINPASKAFALQPGFRVAETDETDCNWEPIARWSWKFMGIPKRQFPSTETTFNIEYEDDRGHPLPRGKIKIISPTMNENQIAEFIAIMRRKKLLKIISEGKSVDSEVTLRILRKSGLIPN